VDISDTFEAKMAAWSCFQGLSVDGQSGATLAAAPAEEPAGSLTEQLECRARYYGSLIGVRYAEALQQSHYLPTAVRDVTAL
jgi:hypothetical protein